MDEHTKGELIVGWGLGLTGPNCAFTVGLESRTRNKFLVISQGDKLIAILPDCENTTKEDAKRLVLCWNSHDDLLAALREIVNYDEARRKTASQDPGIMPKSVVCNIAEAVIAKAKESK